MEFIASRLYFMLNTSLSELCDYENKMNDFVVNLDDLYHHTKVRKHFGPPSLKIIWKHCEEVEARLRKYNHVIFVTNNLNDNLHIEKRTLSSFLMATYGVLVLRWSADHVNEKLLSSIPARLAFFRDYHGDSSYKLTILDCLRGLEIGCNINGWFNSYAFTKFPHAANSDLDMNWIIPGEMMAFKDPTINREKDTRIICKAFMKELKRCGIRVIVRLNGDDHNTNIEYYGKSYNANDFKKEQFFHYEIPFKDVGNPTTVQAHQFVALCERYGGKIAVHCHAGLGRTATMIGCFLIKNFGFDARSACGWLKLCRRGSVMGPQHFFLEKYRADLENIKESAMEISKLSPSTERIFREQAITGGTVSTSTTNPKTNMSRQPIKNNIIHITPMNIHQRTKNPMHKYKFELGVESVDNIKSSTLQVQQRNQQQSELPSRKTERQKQRNIITSIEKPTIRNSTLFKPRPPSSDTRGPAIANGKNSSRENSPQPKKSRKRPRSRLCYSKTPEHQSQTKTAPTKSQTARRVREPMNRRDLESRKTKSRGSGAVSCPSHLQNSNNWSQWGGKVIEGIVSQSKSRIYSLINSVYSRQGIHYE